MKETNVTINVTLDENNIPEKIIWSAPDGGVSDFPAKAMLLSLWDSNNKESLKMDLWVKDMPVEEMKNFIDQLPECSTVTCKLENNETQPKRTLRK